MVTIEQAIADLQNHDTTFGATTSGELIILLERLQEYEKRLTLEQQLELEEKKIEGFLPIATIPQNCYNCYPKTGIASGTCKRISGNRPDYNISYRPDYCPIQSFHRK